MPAFTRQAIMRLEHNRRESVPVWELSVLAAAPQISPVLLIYPLGLIARLWSPVTWWRWVWRLRERGGAVTGPGGPAAAGAGAGASGDDCADTLCGQFYWGSTPVCGQPGWPACLPGASFMPVLGLAEAGLLPVLAAGAGGRDLPWPRVAGCRDGRIGVWANGSCSCTRRAMTSSRP